MPKRNIRFRDNPVLVTWGLLVLSSIMYEIASLGWPRVSYWALDGASKCILLFTGGYWPSCGSAAWRKTS